VPDQRISHDKHINQSKRQLGMSNDEMAAITHRHFSSRRHGACTGRKNAHRDKFYLIF
jgi:hypothetical protein